MKEGQKIWEAAVKAIGGDAKTTIIPWDKFGPIFLNAFNVGKIEDPKVQCIKHLLRVSPSGEVALDKFSLFSQTFSPFRVGPTEGPAYISDLLNLCKEKWFYGLRSRGEAEALLNSEQAKKMRKEKKLPFIIRLSDTKGYQFCISFIQSVNGKDDVQNSLIPPDSYEQIGFYQGVRNEIKKKKLDPLVHPERIFDTILDSSFKALKFKSAANNARSGESSSFLGWSASISSTGSGKFIT